jgi:prepilin-type N-terminal cleavage/methylation domain-containing protein
MKKGFTLIELLVVIAILAVLMSVIVVTLNPAEMLKKTRDTKRISDLDALRTAINLYVTDQGSLPSGTISTNTCYASQIGVSGVPGCTAPYASSTSQAVNGGGWIPINFTAISSGSPLSSLPLDPLNTVGDNTTAPTGWHVYVFKANTSSSTYKLMANMESSYYSYNGLGDVESKDGGTSTAVYEVGSDVTGL